jgi:hypothetical protein
MLIAETHTHYRSEKSSSFPCPFPCYRKCSDHLIRGLPTYRSPRAESNFKIKTISDVLLRLHNIWSKPSYFQVALSAKIVLQNVHRPAVSENIAISVMASRVKPLLTMLSVGKRYSRLQLMRDGFTRDNRNYEQSAKMKEHANVTNTKAYLQTVAELMITTVTVLRNYRKRTYTGFQRIVITFCCHILQVLATICHCSIYSFIFKRSFTTDFLNKYLIFV